jgi:hypothetical protein
MTKNTENKKYIDRVKRIEELAGGSKVVSRTAPSSPSFAASSLSLFVVNLNVCMEVMDEVNCVWDVEWKWYL